jgi:hypothetical protein
MSLQQVEVELIGNENAIGDPAIWTAGKTSKSHRQTGPVTLNARVVEFIAKPGKVRHLEDCIRGQIMGFLNRQIGFSGTIILNSHKEPRLILVVSFWTTQQMAAENCWEKSRVVRLSAGSLIDVCSRVNTYEAAFIKSIDVTVDRTNAHAWWPEVQG